MYTLKPDMGEGDIFSGYVCDSRESLQCSSSVPLSRRRIPFFLFVFLVAVGERDVLGFELRALHMLDRHSTVEPQPQLFLL
jgi:hypothetical protein